VVVVVVVEMGKKLKFFCQQNMFVMMKLRRRGRRREVGRGGGIYLPSHTIASTVPIVGSSLANTSLLQVKRKPLSCRVVNWKRRREVHQA
jgi:hypothetical protein